MRNKCRDGQVLQDCWYVQYVVSVCVPSLHSPLNFQLFISCGASRIPYQKPDDLARSHCYTS
ncbi:Uncharacterized protein APZ42_014285 [Daphnia magna]|uniref:Uncharacterized protein n=1 Tax=Daphnia magna TaxID=35525 RepID=A0A162Q5K1_9CRUS|nr:Uncharacterized protein APZ42_014285 [Daphnia magna]